MKEIILASASPRRKELLKNAGIEFSVCVADIDEKISPSDTPDKAVVSLALQKATAVFEKNKDKIVIGSDTVVVLDGKILGKPKDSADAFKMLKSLSGRTHKVFTGVAILSEEKTVNFYNETSVEFYELTDEEIQNYIETGEPMDKAGSYGIQGKGCTIVRRIDGDFFSVMGLPVSQVYRELKKIDEYVLADSRNIG